MEKTTSKKTEHKPKLKITSSMNGFEITKGFEKQLLEILPEEIKEFEIFDLYLQTVPREKQNWVLKVLIDKIGYLFKMPSENSENEVRYDTIIKILEYQDKK